MHLVIAALAKAQRVITWQCLSNEIYAETALPCRKAMHLE